MNNYVTATLVYSVICPSGDSNVVRDMFALCTGWRVRARNWGYMQMTDWPVPFLVPVIANDGSASDTT